MRTPVETRNWRRRTFLKSVGASALLPFFSPNSNAGISEGKHLATHRILSCNIRVALAEDEARGVGWPQRKDICIEVIKKQSPDIICFQEVLEVQNEDLKKAFPNFFSFGFEGPEMDAHKEGYHGVAKNPIFFSTKKFELISAGCYWLSETPHIGGSKSWDTARARHVNWVRLLDKKSGQSFRVLSLHLDHVSQEARERQIEMMLEESAQYPADFKQVLAGDFNASQANTVIGKLKTAGWIDTYDLVHKGKDPGFTVHSFEGENYPKKDQRKKIDFIFLKGAMRPVSANVIKDHRNGKYPSDHYFISADVEL